MTMQRSHTYDTQVSSAERYIVYKNLQMILILVWFYTVYAYGCNL